MNTCFCWVFLLFYIQIKSVKLRTTLTSVQNFTKIYLRQNRNYEKRVDGSINLQQHMDLNLLSEIFTVYDRCDYSPLK